MAPSTRSHRLASSLVASTSHPHHKMQGVPQFTNAAMMAPACGPNMATLSLNGLIGPQDGRNISMQIDWQNRRMMFQVEYDNIDGAQGSMRAANDAAAAHPLAQVHDRSDVSCRRACPPIGEPSAYPRTHHIRHGAHSISGAPRDVTVDNNVGSQQTARRTGQRVSAEQSTSAPVKTEKVKVEKKVKTEKVKAEKTKKTTHVVKKEKMLFPEKGSAIIRNSKKRTHWYKSEFHKALPKPPSGVTPKPAYLWVHHYDVDKKQIWMWDEVSGDETEDGTPKCDWKKVREGIAHPHPSLNATHVMHVVNDGTPRWVLASSRRERLNRKKKDLVADVDISED